VREATKQIRGLAKSVQLHIRIKTSQWIGERERKFLIVGWLVSWYHAVTDFWVSPKTRNFVNI
jgi:hypothetical protein